MRQRITSLYAVGHKRTLLKYFYYLPDKRKKAITKFESTHSQSNVTGIAALQNDSDT